MPRNKAGKLGGLGVCQGWWRCGLGQSPFAACVVWSASSGQRRPVSAVRLRAGPAAGLPFNRLALVDLQRAGPGRSFVCLGRSFVCLRRVGCAVVGVALPVRLVPARPHRRSAGLFRRGRRQDSTGQGARPRAVSGSRFGQSWGSRFGQSWGSRFGRVSICGRQISNSGNPTAPATRLDDEPGIR